MIFAHKQLNWKKKFKVYVESIFTTCQINIEYFVNESNEHDNNFGVLKNLTL